jgi:hypothetical protein
VVGLQPIDESSAEFCFATWAHWQIQVVGVMTAISHQLQETDISAEAAIARDSQWC